MGILGLFIDAAILTLLIRWVAGEEAQGGFLRVLLVLLAVTLGAILLMWITSSMVPGMLFYLLALPAAMVRFLILDWPRAILCTVLLALCKVALQLLWTWLMPAPAPAAL